MAASSGQSQALDELHQIATAARGAFEVLTETLPEGDQVNVTVDVELSCVHLARVPDGLPIRAREQVTIYIPLDFPFSLPSVHVKHKRFAGFPHVHFYGALCLYQAPQTEWNPSDGMFGFVDRLEAFFRLGALNELDPTGAALHPPATHATSGRLVIPRVDTPVVGDEPWFGMALLRTPSDRRTDVIGWVPLFGEVPVDTEVGAAVLLAQPMPWEMPRKVAGLVRYLERRGVSKRWLLFTIGMAAIKNPVEKGLHVLLGTPMRGIRGGAHLQQHLTAWYIDVDQARDASLQLGQYLSNQRFEEIGEEAWARLWEWAEKASVSWSTVREDRPEIVTRRDRDTPLAWFRGRSIELWGCGALGTHVGEWLTRADVSRLVLHDRGTVTPGILVRQLFDDADVGYGKAHVLKARLQRIRPDIDVSVSTDDVLATRLIEGGLRQEPPDLVIDTTGSRPLVKKLERRWAEGERINVASFVIGPRAERGLLAFTPASHSGGPADVIRQAKLVAALDKNLREYFDEFWPAPGREGAALFQPEPGCSDPTFVGSAADVSLLGAAMLNGLAQGVGGSAAFASFVTRLDVSSTASHRRTVFAPDTVLVDRNAGYHIRLAPSAWSQIEREIRNSRQRRGSRPETGGLLLGERDDAAKVIWITEATPPPRDSRHSPERFVCGTEGTRDLCMQRENTSGGSVRFIGMWHTHPECAANPSDIDLEGMAAIVTYHGASQSLLVIVGYSASQPEPAAYLFRRSDFPTERTESCRVSRWGWFYRIVRLNRPYRADPRSPDSIRSRKTRE